MITTTNNWYCGFKSFFFFKSFLLYETWFSSNFFFFKAGVENGANKSVSKVKL